MNKDENNKTNDKSKKEKNSKLHSGHRERMRQKFIKSGFDNLEDHEILEMLLFYSLPRRNTNDIAHELLNKYHTLTALFNADLNDLMDTEGIGENCAVLFKMIPLLSRKYISDPPPRIWLKAGKTACSYFKPLFIGETTEKMRIVCLNDKLEIIAEKVIFVGNPGNLDTNIRNIVEFTYQNKCDNIILAHNHPNGLAIPSENDIKSNTRLFNVLKSVGINLLDHIIVAGNNAISMNDTGAFVYLK